MGTRVRVLGSGDLAAAMELLSADPIDNLFVLARVGTFGIERTTLGCDVFGVERDGQLVALLHAGSNIIAIGADGEAIDAFATRLGPHRTASSIMGRADQVRPMWEALARRWGESWRRTREIRAHQPVMLIDSPPLVGPDPRVREITLADLGPYYDAAVAMYTEEVGISPVESTGSYRHYVRTLIMNRRAYGIVEDGKVLFKADLGSAFGPACQIQGVWLAPELRGQGVSAPAMAAVVGLVAPVHPHQSLYVNDFNTRARRLYATVGFREVGEFATVLY